MGLNFSIENKTFRCIICEDDLMDINAYEDHLISNHRFDTDNIFIWNNCKYKQKCDEQI